MSKKEESKFVSDEPAIDDLEFGFSDHAEIVADLFANNELPKPFVIGLNGEWGSGKTTFLKEVIRNLEDKRTKDDPIIIYFSSWEYERADVFASLLYKISDKFVPNKKLMNSIARFAFDAALRKVSGMTFGDAKDHFGQLYEGIETFRDKLKKMIDKDVILFIDDLDRCDTDTMLTMLESIKWFLTIDRVLVVIAVDMEKIENAWELRYGNNAAKGIGKDHTEKMFQLKLSIPTKPYVDRNRFVERMRGSVFKNDVEYFVKSMPPNPRKLKLGLNLYHFILKKVIKLHGIERANSDYLRTLITWIGIHSHHRDIAEFVKVAPEPVMIVALMCSKSDHYLVFQDAINKRLQLTNIERERTPFSLTKRLVFKSAILIPPVLKILEICSTNKAAFDVLQQYGNILKINLDGYSSQNHIGADELQKLDPYSNIFNNVINDSML
ncbi:hypothetical protein IBTHAUMO2_690030 [Nitrosopumilaceae archaeon]|nr:hypothetical protein IBTHAUMO2_690030 [Nitrosopumilaceae archaeon]